MTTHGGRTAAPASLAPSFRATCRSRFATMRARGAQCRTAIFGFAYAALRFYRKEPARTTFSLLEKSCVLEGEHGLRASQPHGTSRAPTVTLDGDLTLDALSE
jgi:hypothetical protein